MPFLAVSCLALSARQTLPESDRRLLWTCHYVTMSLYGCTSVPMSMPWKLTGTGTDTECHESSLALALALARALPLALLDHCNFVPCLVLA